MTIIDDILDFSKIESGKLRLEHQKLDLVRILPPDIMLLVVS